MDSASCFFSEALKKRSTPFIIGITGDSGSGKTTYSDTIKRFFGKELVNSFTMDGYHKENREQREKSGKLPLDPEANRLELFLEHLKLLKQGKGIQLPIYNHEKGDFDPPITFTPAPIVIIEGLHVLYPEFLPYIDFSIYVDPSREVKWEWKYKRDVVDRHHQVEPLVEEMLRREAAYKRWIDFQKTNAKVVIKIEKSRIKDLALYECINTLPEILYRAELIMEEVKIPLPDIVLPLDLAALADINRLPFSLAAVASSYWGRKVMVIHIDGIFPKETIAPLEQYLIKFTCIDGKFTPDEVNNQGNGEQVDALQVVRLIVAWRFTAKLQYHLTHNIQHSIPVI